MKIFDYLFCHVYRQAKALGNSFPEHNGIMFLSILECMNFLVLLNLFSKFIYTLPIREFRRNNIVFVPVIFAIYAFNYYRYGREKKYWAILKRFSTESEKERRNGNYITVLYALLSFLAVGILWTRKW
ncbi:MAG: hypothetical protein ACM3SM_03400 [Bacteroidota bacterium]